MLDKYIVAKYLRLSLDDGDKPESDSIANQRNLIDFHIKKLFPDKDIEVIELIDDGYTGTNMNRPGMRKLLILAETREINCVIVKDFSRFARDYVEVGLYAEQRFPEWEVRFVSVNDAYDSLDFRGITGGIDIALKNITYTMYSRDLSEKVKSARRIQYKNGKFVAPYAFYGYKKSPEDKHKLIVDPVAAEVVKRIFNMRVSGITPSKIAIILNREGILTPARYKKSVDPLCREWNTVSGYNYWTASLVGNILRDERYTGKLISGKMERAAVGSTKVKRAKKENIIVVDNMHEAIISQELYDSVQAISKKRQNPKPSRISLRSLVKCGGCKHTMTVANTSGKCKRYYCSYKKYTDENNCFQGNIDENDLVDFITKTIMTELQKTVDIEKVQEKLSAKLKENEKIIKGLQQKIEAQKRKKLDDYLMLTKGELTETEFISKREKIDMKIAEYEKSKNELKKETVSYEDLSMLDLFGKYIGTKELNREVIQDLIKEIYVYPDKRIEIVWDFKEKIL